MMKFSEGSRDEVHALEQLVHENLLPAPLLGQIQKVLLLQTTQEPLDHLRQKVSSDVLRCAGGRDVSVSHAMLKELLTVAIVSLESYERGEMDRTDYLKKLQDVLYRMNNSGVEHVVLRLYFWTRFYTHAEALTKEEDKQNIIRLVQFISDQLRG